jgi:NADP-dependent 3-hydroxy acid dehydrogenase YdfG
VRPTFSVYNASKFGVTAFSEALRQELAPDGIRVSCVQPGAVDTELLSHVDESVRDRLRASALGTVSRITADDVAALIEHLVELDPAVALSEVVVRSARTPY